MKHIIAILLFLFPVKLVKLFCVLIRYRGLKIMGKNVSVGFSFIIADQVELHENSRIGHLNLIKCKNVSIEGGGENKPSEFYKGRFFYTHGP